MNKPSPTHFTRYQGGDWIPWEERARYTTFYNQLPSHFLHSIKFEDGSIFDMVNGWRKREHTPVEKVMLELAAAIEKIPGSSSIHTFLYDTVRGLRQRVDEMRSD